LPLEKLPLRAGLGFRRLGQLGLGRRSVDRSGDLAVMELDRDPLTRPRLTRGADF